MIEIPINQTWYKINIDTQFDVALLDTATKIQMKFKSPSGVDTIKDAIRVINTSQIEFELVLQKDVLNTIGKWAVWPFITGPDGRVAPSKKATAIKVIPEGTV